jgi:LemA protein
MKNKTGLFIGIGVIVLLFILAISSYNGLVSAKTSAEGAFANIDAQLQRRSDLIPNLVETVKGATQHEQSIVNSVTDARAKLAGAGTIDEKIAASGELSSALSRLLVVVENYPDIKSNQNFIALQDELAGTENRIGRARSDYNEAVKIYNAKIQYFPSNIFANMFGFKSMN